MIARPPSSEWCVEQLPANRLAYLASNAPFEEIVEDIMSAVRVVQSHVKPYRDPHQDEAKEARQVTFVVDVGGRGSDLLYNAPDGLRARYWQSPDLGFCATRHLLDQLLPKLISFVEEKPPVHCGGAIPMCPHTISASLMAHSAKAWPLEREGNNLLLVEPPLEEQLLVQRWIENEEHAQVNKGMWRRTPTGGALEIKGGLLAPDGTEHVPPYKRDRSCQIHRFGFT